MHITCNFINYYKNFSNISKHEKYKNFDIKIALSVRLLFYCLDLVGREREDMADMIDIVKLFY